MPHLDLPTHRLHYCVDDEDETKPWLTFCNSLGTDLHMWDEQIADLARDFRILRYDRRGHGLSTAPQPPYALADLGRDLVALWDRLGIARTHLCGLSIGGLTAQWIGVHAPQRLDRLIVCATAARIGTAQSWQDRIDTVAASGLAPLAEATAERWFTPAFRAAQPGRVVEILTTFVATSVPGYVGCCAALADADLTGDLDRIRIPVLAIAGADDPVCPPADLAAIAAGVADGRMLTLPGRHILNVESAAAFNAAVRSFLRP